MNTPAKAVPASNSESLLNELEQAAKNNSSWGWRNYFCAYIVAMLGIGCSVAATIVAAVGTAPHWVTALIAAVPGILLAVGPKFNFERKALWQWGTTKSLERLKRKLQYENAEVSEVSREFSEIDSKTFDGWTIFSALSREMPESRNNEKIN